MSSLSQRRDKSHDLALVGATIAGKYRVLDVLGQGGFGSVFLVEIVAGMVGEKLALKLIPKELSEDEKVKSQFLNEIRVAMRMVNKYIVQVRDVGETEEGQLYYTMDYCPGRTLAQIVKREGKLSTPRLIPIVLRVLEALKTAHAAGVVHRDLKPANVMVFQQDGYETARVLDFGIATAMGAAASGGTSFVGSPHYMPPEQFINETLGSYTDIYSVGVILYEGLTGQKPYQGRTPQEVYNDLKSRPATAPDQANPELTAYPGLSALIARCLERNPELRYQTAKDLFNDLKAILEGESEPAPAAAPAAIPAAAAVARKRRAAVTVAARSSRPSNSLASGIAIAGGVAVLGAVAAILIMNWGEPDGSEPIGQGPPAAGGADPAPPPPVAPDVPPADPQAIVVAQPPPAEKQATPKAEAGNVAPPKVDPQAARREAEERARKRLAEAVSHAKSEKWDKVREVCQDAVLLDASLVEAVRLKGQAELRLGMFDEALVSFGRAKTLTPPEKVDANLLLLMIEAYRGLPASDPDAVADLLEEAQAALRKDSPNPAALVKLLQLLEERGQEAEVMALVEAARAQKLSDPLVESLHTRYFVELPKKREAEAEEILKVARKALDDGDFAQAALKAHEGYRLKPLAELGFVLAEAHHGAGKVPETLAALSDVGRRLRDDSEAIARLGILYGRAYVAQYEAAAKKKPDLLDRAIENLDAALEALADPKVKSPVQTATAHTYKARCYALQASVARLDEALKAARSAYGRDPELIYHQAQSYFLLGELTKDPDRSASYLRSIQRLADYNDFPQGKRDPRGYYLMGLCYLRMGGKRDNFDKALNQFPVAERYGMKTDPALYEAWAESYLGLGDYIRAGQKYRSAFEIKPSEELCLKTANCFVEASSKISAEKILRDGLALFPNSAAIQSLLSRISR